MAVGAGSGTEYTPSMLCSRMRLAALVCALAAASAAAPAEAGGMTAVPPTATTPAVPIYIARPDGAGPFPAVLLLHGCDGFTGFGAVAADRLSFRGYVAVALDSEGPHSAPGACVDPKGSSTEAADARATLAWMRAQPYIRPDRLAVMGFSMGASATLDLIDRATGAADVPAGLRAAIAFYPACENRTANVAVPLIIFDGDADRITPAAPCAALVKAATDAGKTATITTYPGVTHAFNIPGFNGTFYGEPIRYDSGATLDSAQRTEQFLARYLLGN